MVQYHPNLETHVSIIDVPKMKHVNLDMSPIQILCFIVII
jgi:hypothetical protein